MSFHPFLGTRGSFHYIFYQHHGYVVLYIPPLELLELIERWHFAVALCDANSDCGRDSKGHYSQSIHTCLRRLGGWGWGCRIGWRGHGFRHVTVWEMTFYRDHLHLWLWVSADSAQVNCFLCLYAPADVCTETGGAFSFFFLLRLYFIPPPCLSACSYFIFAAHAHAGKHSIWERKKCTRCCRSPVLSKRNQMYCTWGKKKNNNNSAHPPLAFLATIYPVGPY